MTRLGQVVLSSLALGAALSADLCAQGIPEEHAAPRRAGGHGDPGHGREPVCRRRPRTRRRRSRSRRACATRLASVAGSGLLDRVRHDHERRRSSSSAIRANAILSPANALILAKQIPGTKGIITSTLTRPEGGPYTMTSRFFGVQCRRRAWSESTSRTPGEKLEAFGAARGRRASSRPSTRSTMPRRARTCGPPSRRRPTKAADKVAQDRARPGPGAPLPGRRSPSPRRSRGRQVVAHLQAATKGDPLSLTAWTLLAEQHEQAGDTAAVDRRLQADAAGGAEQPEAARGDLQVPAPGGQAQRRARGGRRGPQARPEQLADLYDLKSNACLFQSDFKCAIDALAQAYAVDSTQGRLELLQEDRASRRRSSPTRRGCSSGRSAASRSTRDNLELLGYAEQGYMLTGQMDSTVAVAKRLLAVDPTAVDPALAAVQSLAAAGRIAEAMPLIDMVQAKGSPQQKEQLSAILANAALPLLQKADYPAGRRPVAPVREERRPQGPDRRELPADPRPRRLPVGGHDGRRDREDASRATWRRRKTRW